MSHPIPGHEYGENEYPEDNIDEELEFVIEQHHKKIKKGGTNE